MSWVMRWMREVTPPVWISLSVVLVASVCAGLYNLCGWRFGAWDMTRQFFLPRDAAILFAAVFYGAWRIVSKHPVFVAPYWKWLALTPWTRKHPLPLGPIELVPQDAILVGLLVLLMAYHPLSHLSLVPLCALVAYQAALALALVVTGERRTAIAAAVGLGVVVRLAWWSPWAALAAGAANYLIARWGLWESLARFPWRREASRAIQVSGQHVMGFVRPPAATIDWSCDVGMPELPFLWPHNVLHFKRAHRSLEPGDSIALSLLAGWWTYVLTVPYIHLVPLPWMAYFVLAFSCVGGRLFRYVVCHDSPISLWGRIRTLRWVIPGYDRVFLTPLLTALIAIGLPTLLDLCQAPSAINLAASTTVLLLVTFLGPPRLREWQLTAPVRLVPWKRQRQIVEEI